MRNVRLLFGGLLAACAIVVTPAIVQAKCAGPQPLLSSGAGSRLPPNPVLYLFWPGHAARTPPKLLASDGQGHAVTVEQTEAGETEAFKTYRVKFLISRAGPMTVKLAAGKDFYLRTDKWAFSIDPDWKPPVVAKRSSALDVQAQSSRWTCSYQFSQNLIVPMPASAFRVAVANSEEDYRAGRLRSYILPYHMGMFFGRSSESGSKLPDQGEIQLGHSNCIGSTYSWGTAPIYVGVFALQADGSEASFGLAPLRVEPPNRATLPAEE